MPATLRVVTCLLTPMLKGLKGDARGNCVLASILLVMQGTVVYGRFMVGYRCFVKVYLWSLAYGRFMADNRCFFKGDLWSIYA